MVPCYDYNALVTEISQHRQIIADLLLKHHHHQQREQPNDVSLLLTTHLSAVLDAFDRLSSHCPMTPKLWIQYAHDAFQLVVETSKQQMDGHDDE